MMQLPDTLDQHPAFVSALDAMETSQQCLFITGKAGTGKSTLLAYFCQQTKKRPVVVAPTGVAAINVKGQTIHRFFHFTPDVTPQKIAAGEVKPNAKSRRLYSKLKTLIIDEVSMLRADLLDCIDEFLRRYGTQPTIPFGGVQIIFVGDLYQLPPVVMRKEQALFRHHYETPYFFSAKVMVQLPLRHIELEKVYRQKQADFIMLLNRIRNNSADATDIARLNARYSPTQAGHPSEKQFYVHLTATNRQADAINAHHLAKLDGKTHETPATITGIFGREYYPTALELDYKIGAQIMLLNNDPRQRWVNGTMGRIADIKKDQKGQQYLRVQLEASQRKVSVYPYTWEVYQFKLDKGAIVSEPMGTFTQYPIRLAWAMTIHKSQGKTFEHVIIDMQQGAFASGQVYVALSRCTTLAGIILTAPIKPHHILTDQRIVTFLTNYQYQQAAQHQPLSEKLALLQWAIEAKCALTMAYLKGNDTKTQRQIRPIAVNITHTSTMTYHRLHAYCYQHQAERLFRVECILTLSKVMPPLVEK